MQRIRGSIDLRQNDYEIKIFRLFGDRSGDNEEGVSQIRPGLPAGDRVGSGVVVGQWTHYEAKGFPKTPTNPLKSLGIPYEIRTRVTAVKGRCPRPLDERDRGSRWVAEAEPAVKRWCYSFRLVRQKSSRAPLRPAPRRK